jgi:transposase
MGCADSHKESLIPTVTLEELVAAAHPLRPVRA